MRTSSGPRRIAIGFAAAMALTVLLSHFSFISQIPFLQESAPREIPVALVGDKPEVGTVRDALNGLPHSPVAARIVADAALADDLLMRREVTGVLTLGDAGAHTLTIASAGGAREAAELEQVVTSSLAVSQQSATVKDAVPAPASDPSGIHSSRLAGAWVLLGVLLAAVIGFVAGPRALTVRRALERIGAAAVGAAIGALGGSVIVVEIGGWLDAPILTLAAFGTLLILAVAIATAALRSWFGAYGIAAALLVFLVLGVPGSTGSYPLTPLPSVWPTMIAWLPPGAGTWAIRGIADFDGVGVARVVWLYLAWIVVGTLLILTAVGGRTGPEREFHPVLRRRPVLSSLIGIAALLLAVFVPAVSAINTVDLTPALTITCRPFTPPTDVKGLNEVVTSYLDQDDFTGGDVGASTVLSDDRQVLVFGDTLRGSSYAHQRMVRNSMLVFGPDCAGVVKRRDQGAVIPNRADGTGYWPMSIATVERDGYDLVGVMAQRVRSTDDTGADLFGFENLGPALAVFRVDPGGVPVLQRVVDFGQDDASTENPTWGAAAAVVGDQVYLYGTAHSADDPVFGWALSVARVPLESIGDQSTWRFWDGTSWQRDAERAAELIPSTDGVSQTLSVFESDGTWYALSKRGDFVGRDLVAWTSPSPTGPFTAQPPLAQIPSTGTSLLYMPLAHPGILPEAGTMVVSISRNTLDSDQIADDPTLYRPEFIRVTLPLR